MATQTFGDQKKAVIFPVVNTEGKVISLWAGIVNEERDYANFYFLDNTSEEVLYIKEAFQKYYRQKSARKNDDVKTSDIPEVVIYVIKPLEVDETLPSWWYDGGIPPGTGTGDGLGNGMNGDGSNYHGGSGSGGNETTDPCSKMKTQVIDSKFIEKKNDLMSKTKLKSETGYTQHARTGEYTYRDNSSSTDFANSLTLPDAEKFNIKSYMHTHVDNYTTVDIDGNEIIKTGIKMFSPRDVLYLMDMLRNAKTRGIDFSEVSATMISSSGNYTMRFTGNENQLRIFTEDQMTNFTASYITYMNSDSTLSLEEKFLKFLEEKMNVRAIVLFKLNDDNTATKLALNSDKTALNKSNCP